MKTSKKLWILSLFVIAIVIFLPDNTFGRDNVVKGRGAEVFTGRGVAVEQKSPTPAKATCAPIKGAGVALLIKGFEEKPTSSASVTNKIPSGGQTAADAARLKQAYEGASALPPVKSGRTLEKIIAEAEATATNRQLTVVTNKVQAAMVINRQVNASSSIFQDPPSIPANAPGATATPNSPPPDKGGEKEKKTGTNSATASATTATPRAADSRQVEPTKPETGAVVDPEAGEKQKGKLKEEARAWAATLIARAGKKSPAPRVTTHLSQNQIYPRAFSVRHPWIFSAICGAIGISLIVVLLNKYLTAEDSEENSEIKPVNGTTVFYLEKPQIADLKRIISDSGRTELFLGLDVGLVLEETCLCWVLNLGIGKPDIRRHPISKKQLQYSSWKRPGWVRVEVTSRPEDQIATFDFPDESAGSLAPFKEGEVESSG